MKSEIIKWVKPEKISNRIFFITLTTRYPQSQEKFEKLLFIWLRNLKSDYFGRKNQPELFHLAVFEESLSEMLHAHILIEDFGNIASTKKFKCNAPFQQHSIKSWLKLKESGKSVAQNIQVVYSLDGIFDYTLKNVWCSKKIDQIPLNLLSIPTKYMVDQPCPSG